MADERKIVLGLNSINAAGLRKVCRGLGLGGGGTRPELVKRLRQYAPQLCIICYATGVPLPTAETPSPPRTAVPRTPPPRHSTPQHTPREPRPYAATPPPDTAYANPSTPSRKATKSLLEELYERARQEARDECEREKAAEEMLKQEQERRARAARAQAAEEAKRRMREEEERWKKAEEAGRRAREKEEEKRRKREEGSKRKAEEEWRKRQDERRTRDKAGTDPDASTSRPTDADSRKLSKAKVLRAADVDGELRDMVKSHERRWAKFRSAATAPADARLVRFKDFPFPTFKTAKEASSTWVAPSAVREYLLFARMKKDATWRGVVREAIREFHPDRIGRLLGWVVDGDHDRVRLAAVEVTKSLNELLAEI